MTITAAPGATKVAYDPDRIELESRELIVTGLHDSGSSRRVHLVHNDDIGVIFAKAHAASPGADTPPHSAEDTGVVVVSLGVDSDHDEVHYDINAGDIDDLEALEQAIETLRYAAEALRRVQKAEGVM